MPYEFEQGRPAPALDRGGELPAEIDGVAHAGVHAEPARRRVLVHAVAGEEDVAVVEPVGDELAAGPAQRRDDLVGDVVAQGAADRRRDQLGRRLVAILLAVHVEAPQLAPVDLDDAAILAVLADQEVERGLAVRVPGPQLVDAQEDVEVVAEHRAAFLADAQRLADARIAARAIDQEAGADAVGPAGLAVAHRGDDAVGVALERFEAAAITHRDGREASRQLAQDRVEPDLVAALRPLRRGRQRLVAAVGRPLDAADFVARQAGEVQDGRREVRRRPRGAHLVGDAPAAAELHRARVHRVGPRVVDRAVALLDQQALDAAPAEIGGEPQPHRPAAEDKYGCLCVHRVLPRRKVQARNRRLKRALRFSRASRAFLDPSGRVCARFRQAERRPSWPRRTPRTTPSTPR